MRSGLQWVEPGRGTSSSHTQGRRRGFRTGSTVGRGKRGCACLQYTRGAVGSGIPCPWPDTRGRRRNPSRRSLCLRLSLSHLATCSFCRHRRRWMGRSGSKTATATDTTPKRSNGSNYALRITANMLRIACHTPGSVAMFSHSQSIAADCSLVQRDAGA